MKNAWKYYLKTAGRIVFGLLVGGLLGSLLGTFVSRFFWGDEKDEKTSVVAAEPEKSTDPFVVLTEEDTEYLRQIICEITEGKHTRVEKILAVHDWMIRNIQYDCTHTQHDAHDTLNNRIAVCSGYSALFQDFMYELGIPSKRISGLGGKPGDTGRHSWNAVMLEDGLYYYIDVCWDDPIMNGTSDYPDGENLKYTYFLLGEDSMGKNHTPDYSVEGTATADYDWKAVIPREKWIQYGDRWVWYQADGNILKSEWVLYKDKWYYLDQDGYMVTGWRVIGSRHYFFKEDGDMAQDEWISYGGTDWYFDHDGHIYE